MKGQHIRNLLKCEPDFAAVFELFVGRFRKEIEAITEGCLEMSHAGYWLAHNPHDVRTYSSKGNLLEAGVVYVEKDNWPVAMFSAEGGFTMSGLEPRGPEMLQVLSQA